MKWPSKEDREHWEINQFIHHYERATSEPGLRILSKGERPDYVLVSGSLESTKYGVELTSVYNDDRSVPDNHIPPQAEVKNISYLPSDVENYQIRVLDAIKTKDKKARGGYSTEHPLLLSIYINEYLAIHITLEEWRTFFKENNFNIETTVFKAIVLWPLPDNHEFLLSEV